MLKKSVPPFVAEMAEMRELFAAEQPELDKLETDAGELLRQFYIKTATYSLDRWEHEFGLVKNQKLTLVERRLRLLAKLQERPMTTVERLTWLVQQLVGLDTVYITEHYADYRFTIEIETDKLLGRTLLKIVSDAICQARPAHLAYDTLEKLDRKTELAAYYGIVGKRRVNYRYQANTDGLCLVEKILIGAFCIKKREGSVKSCGSIV